MASWTWLTGAEASYTRGFIARVLVKALILFVLLNLAFVMLDPLPALGRLSIYNLFVPGRLRLPYGENPVDSYNLSLTSLEAMFASHVLSRPKEPDEFRVLTIGDSSTWGFLLRPEHTVAGQLNAARLVTEDGRRVRVYNLGYPEMSLTKDLLLLDRAMAYDPDLVIWLFTLESFVPEDQLEPFLLQRNPAPVRDLIRRYELRQDTADPRFHDPTFLERTLVGRRRELADWLRLQVYGVAWAATGIDQFYPETFDLRTSDFDEDVSWHGFAEPTDFAEADLAFDVLAAGVRRVGAVPILLVNEPMFISAGRNSDLRYNFFYPHWAYDSYRALLHDLARRQNWPLLDLWDQIAPDEFTDSPVHMTPRGTARLAERLAPAILAAATSPA